MQQLAPTHDTSLTENQRERLLTLAKELRQALQATEAVLAHGFDGHFRVLEPVRFGVTLAIELGDVSIAVDDLCKERDGRRADLSRTVVDGRIAARTRIGFRGRNTHATR